jgi:hypothetical protein
MTGHGNGSVAIWLEMLSRPPRKRTFDAIDVSCEKSSTTLAQMRWQRLAPSWQARYVMKLARPGQPDRIVPWLNALTIGGQWGVGCTACAVAKLPGAYAGFSIRTVAALKNSNLKKHEVSTFHIKAAKPSTLQTRQDRRFALRWMLRSSMPSGKLFGGPTEGT